MSPVAESKIDVCLVAPALLMDERDRLAGVWLRATGAPSVELLQRPEASDAITSLQGAVAVFTDRV